MLIVKIADKDVNKIPEIVEGSSRMAADRAGWRWIWWRRHPTVVGEGEEEAARGGRRSGGGATSLCGRGLLGMPSQLGGGAGESIMCTGTLVLLCFHKI
jgi:hypothetical protein